jgi:acetyltransferase
MMAVDARPQVASAQPGPARLAISHYPKELEPTKRLRDWAGFRLRPIRPEDEPLLHNLANHMSPQDLPLRFFTAMKGSPISPRRG